LDVEPKRWFALGTVSASFLWFFGLAILAAWPGPTNPNPKTKPHNKKHVGLVILFYSIQHAKKGKKKLKRILKKTFY
ncbi:arginine transporter, partial [Enterobacter hormaechei]